MAVLIDYIRHQYPWFTVQLILCNVLQILLIAVVYKWIWQRINMYILSLKLPGPVAFPFIGCTLSLKKLWPSGAINEFFKDCTKYPSPFRYWLGPTFFVVVHDPDDVECILNENYVQLKPKYYYYLSEGMGIGLLTGRGGEFWKKHRSLLNPSFSTPVVCSYEDTINKQCNILVNEIKPLCGKGTVNFKKYSERLCSDLIAACLFGDNNTNFQVGNSDHILNAIPGIYHCAQERTVNFWMHCKFLYSRTECNRKMNNHRSIIEKYVTELFEMKKPEYFKKQKSQENNLESIEIPMDVLIEAENNKGFSKSEAIQELMNIFIAGVDSMSTTLSFFVLMLSMHKDCQKRLFKEINDYYLTENRSTIKIEDVDKLTYLDMCFKEVMRLFPNAIFLFKEAGDNIQLSEKNITIPKGTIIAIPTYYNCMNSNHWKDPKKFNPDRFSPELEEKMHAFAHIPFSAGPRMCIGLRVGAPMIKIAIISLIREFEFHSTWKLSELPLSFDMSVRSAWEYKMSIVERE